MQTSKPARRVPVELLTEIAALACTDGGKAGRSLSLASRYFSAVVEPFQWKTLAFHNLREFESFASCVSRASDRKKRGARHMFISSPALGDDGHGSPWDTIRDPVGPVPLFRNVFDAVAPTLETLVFYDNTHPKFGLFQSAVLRAVWRLSAGWPKLAEITLRARDANSYAGEAGRLKGAIPHLQRLHFSAPNSLHTYSRLVNSFKQPIDDSSKFHVTHLRFSEVNERFIRGMVEFMVQTLDLVKAVRALQAPELAEKEEILGEEDRLLPLGLKHFIIQPTFLEDRAATERYLEGAASGSRWLKGVLTLLPTAEYGIAEVYKEWINRAEGGPGFWEAVEG